MKISLRKLQKDDLNYFTKWWKDIDLIDLTSCNFDPLSDEEVKEYFDDMLNSKSDNHWMIEAEGEIIGHINLSRRDNDWYETQIVIGEKDYLNQGFGPQAIRLMLEEAKNENIDQIYLEVRPENTRAIRAYEKAGFEKIRTIKYPDNPNLPETIRMEYIN